MSVCKDSQKLKNVVLTGNCQNLSEVLKMEYSYMDIEKVLSYALRYREFEVGKLLIDSLWGMQLEDTSFRLDSCLAISLVKMDSSAFTNIKEFGRYPLKNEFKSKNLSITPVEERLRFVHYFLEVSPNAKELFVPLLMLLSVCAKDFEMYEACQNEGYSLAELKDKYYYFNIMSLVSRLLKNLSYDDFMEVVPILIRDMPMSRFNFAYTICSHNCSKFSTPQGFELFCQMSLKHTPITRIMKYLISENKPDLLNIALNYGWLKNKTVRTNIFNYAQSINNPEIMAIILNYVNKNVDREKEALAEQKRQERLFNASPTSMLYLKSLWHFSICKDGTATVWGYKGDAVDIVIPSMIGKHKVTTVGGGMHNSCGRFKNKSIKSVVVPEGVITIGGHAFFDCKSLLSIKLPSTLENISPFAFYSCESLEEITLPSSLKYMGMNCFSCCESLQKITIPRSVSQAVNSLFYNCTSLSQVTFEEGVIEISLDNLFTSTRLPSRLNPIELVLPASLKTLLSPYYTARRDCANKHFSDYLSDDWKNRIKNCVVYKDTPAYKFCKEFGLPYSLAEA